MKLKQKINNIDEAKIFKKKLYSNYIMNEKNI